MVKGKHMGVTSYTSIIREASLRCFMDWSWLPTDGSDGSNDIVFSIIVYSFCKDKGNIWALFCCIPEIELQNGGLKIIENDVDVHAITEIRNRGKNVAATVIQDDVEGIEVIDAKVFKVLDSIDAEVLAKQQKLDKGKGKMSEADIFISKKHKPLQSGNGITIRENENPLPIDTDSSDSEDYGQSESESDCSEKSFII
ncbi:hypothetical protein Tco_1422281 [Tanacetum coccineum]